MKTAGLSLSIADTIYEGSVCMWYSDLWYLLIKARWLNEIVLCNSYNLSFICFTLNCWFTQNLNLGFKSHITSTHINKAPQIWSTEAQPCLLEAQEQTIWDMRTHETRQNKPHLFLCIKQARLSCHLSCLLSFMCVILTSVDCMNTSNPNMLIMEMCVNVFHN